MTPRPVSTPEQRHLPVVATLSLVVLLLAGCSRNIYRQPDLRGLYDRAAQYHLRNPVVVIPGALGSRLVDPASGTTVWGAFRGRYANPKRASDLRLLALPLDSPEGREPRDDIEASGVLDHVRARLLGIPLQLRAYANILATLGAGGYRDESLALSGAVDWGDDHFTCFQFDYDWRHDNVYNARLLHQFLLEKRREVAAELERRFGISDREIKFDVVAHSMGGLLTRYYLRRGAEGLPPPGAPPEITWDGADLVERVVLIAPPNAGSVLALRQLLDGRDFGPFLPEYPAALIGTFPASYQLLPRPRHGAVVWSESGEPVGDHLDPLLWERHGWGLAAAEAEPVLAALLPEIADSAQRRQLALRRQRQSLQRARSFFAVLDQQAVPPPGLEIFLVAGDAVATPSQIAIDRETGAIQPSGWGPGDGTVLRSSALMDERQGGEWLAELSSPESWEEVLFVFSDHLGMTRDPAFSDNVLYWLLEEPRR